MENQIIAITGVTGGIGKACAIQALRKGWTPILLGRSEKDLTTLYQEIAQYNSNSKHYILDVTNEQRVKETVEEILTDYGKVDAWINNAGYGIFDSLTEANIQDYTGMMDANYFGTVYCTKEILPSMIREDKGAIINVASVAGLVSTAKSCGYSASKAAVIQFTRCLRQELRGTGIRVLSVNPGPVRTPFFDRSERSLQYKQSVESFMISPEKVANAILQGVEKGKKDITLPAYMGIGAKLNSLFPSFYEAVIAPVANKK